MSIKITLTEEQITDVLDNDSSLKYQLFRDSAGPDSICEDSTFPDRLKFYMDKKGVTSKDVVNFFKTQYPFLAKSTSSIQHYINGVRTPKLSAVFALADFLNIAPALLLPAKPGKYIEYKGDHVEMIEPIQADMDPEEVTEIIPGTLDALDSITIQENNNVVVSETEIETTEPEEDSTTLDTNDVSEDNNVVIEEEDYIQSDPQVHEHSLGTTISEKNSDDEDEDEIKPITSLEVEEDDFDDSGTSDDVKDADDFLRELFSNTGTTPYDDYKSGTSNNS